VILSNVNVKTNERNMIIAGRDEYVGQRRDFTSC